MTEGAKFQVVDLHTGEHLYDIEPTRTEWTEDRTRVTLHFDRCMFRRDDPSGFMVGCLKAIGHVGAHSCDEP